MREERDVASGLNPLSSVHLWHQEQMLLSSLQVTRSRRSLRHQRVEWVNNGQRRGVRVNDAAGNVIEPSDAVYDQTQVEQMVRGVCGTLLDDLVFAMRDHLIQPGTLPLADDAAVRQPALAVAYDRCAARLAQHLAALPAEAVVEVRGWLPWHLAEVEDRHLLAATLEVATERGYYDLDLAAFSAADPDARLYQSHPDLLRDTDHDGLLEVASYEAQPQALFYKGSAVPYHPFLWRNFAGNVNDALTQSLLEVGTTAAASLRLALNEQHFMAASAFSAYLESDYWWGPPLSSETLDDPRNVGVTVYGDPQSGLMHEYPRLFVDWSMDKEGHKVLQIEELSDHPGASHAGLRLLRYLHAIRDVERGVFIHCDGAVRAYTHEQYEAREAKNYVTGRESAGQYRKVFRLDGNIETDAWSNIAACWFRGNLLLKEYLDRLSTGTGESSEVRRPRV